MKDAMARRRTSGTAPQRRADDGDAMKDAMARRRPRGTATHRRADAGIAVKRVYEPTDDADGYRILVDRLWLRGLSKTQLRLDAWHKEIAPSDALRRWFGHDPARWYEFVERYRAELRNPTAAALLDEIAARAKQGRVTLLYGARDELHNQAVVLADIIRRKIRAKTTPTKGSATRG